MGASDYHPVQGRRAITNLSSGRYEALGLVSTYLTTSASILVILGIYMLFAGWEVRMVKNCDQGLENAARGRRPCTV